ncbi:hypothetical protein [uncultured Amphritea sp.]|uniref:phage major capsid protein n=1 Tax=uncultured Amphritea sp. TaxID=981605 RepID=UPI00261D2B9C|nr:hypothetical protein [uncultured Amphritea sp.]
MPNGLPISAGNNPDYSSSGVNGFQPQIWSGKMIEKLYASTCFAEIANTDYEGEIKNKGDSVVIRTNPDIAINDYELGMDLTYETPESDKVEMQIDKGKYFGFRVDDVVAHQSDLKLMDNWSNDAGQQMKIQIDKVILAGAFVDVAAENAGATAGVESVGIDMGTTGAPVAITKADVIDVIVDAGTILDEQNVPDTDRWIVLPAWMCALLKKSDLKDASMTGDGTSPLRNGRIGMIDRFMVYQSNNLAKTVDGATTVTNVIFGHKKALTFASQMTKMEELPHPTKFGRLVRGLNVFGSKVIDPKAIGHLYCYKG